MGRRLRAGATTPEPTVGDRLRRVAAEYRWPLLAVIVAVPITLHSVQHSLRWPGSTFPGFFVMSNRVISNVSGYRWPPDKDTLFHSRIIAVDGTAVRSSAEVYDYVAARPIGTPIRYTLSKQDRVFELSLPTLAFSTADYAQTSGILFLFGCISLLLALVVGFLQPRTTQARVYLFSGVVAGLYAITGTLLYLPDPCFIRPLYFFAEAFFPATWIHLALVFPVARSFTGARRAWPILPYVVSAVLAGAWLGGFYREPPNLTPLYAAFVYTAFAILFFDYATLFAYREDHTPIGRSRIKGILIGLVVATLLPLVVFVNSSASGGDFPLQFGLILAPLFYGTVAYSIAKYDLFDVDRFVRQSFVYATLSVLILGTYAAVLASTARLVPNFAEHGQAILSAVFVLAVAFALDPMRSAIQNVVDRAFYRARLDYRATIRELSGLLTTLLDLQEVVGQVTRVVGGAMQLESITLCLLEGEGGEGALWRRTADGEPLRQQAGGALGSLARALAEFPDDCHGSHILSRIEDADEREEVRKLLENTLAARMILPLISRGRPVGVLAMGAKRSGNPFSSDDVDLMRTLANQTAIAIQNARSYQDLEDLTRNLDEKVRQKTRELRDSHDELSRAYNELKDAQAQLIQSEKMASLGQLVAGVAHELNNPASFVHGAMANLEEYLRRFMAVLEAYERIEIPDRETAQALREVREQLRLDYLLRQTPDLLRISAEGTERIKHIVDDLRVFARADRGERATTDIAEGLDSTIRLLSSRIAEAGISLKPRYAAGVLLEANGSQLNQVWMNLLSNAIDAVEGQANPEIEVVARLIPPAHPGGERDTGSVEVQVRDNGVGMEPGIVAKIFEPFFTTKESGRGTGLGMSIAYGAVKSHGGTIEVESRSGAGTTVTVRLPVGRKAMRAA